MFEVIYASLSGNTKQIAEAIAGELGIKAEDVKTKKELQPESAVILGSYCHGGPSRELLRFIEKNDFKGRKVFLFGTSGTGKGDELDGMEKALEGKECRVLAKFCCRGRFLFANREHPNLEELESARRFARHVAQV
ncbi:MAG: flavodoxin family protein [Chloroflexota bacterium]